MTTRATLTNAAGASVEIAVGDMVPMTDGTRAHIVTIEGGMLLISAEGESASWWYRRNGEEPSGDPDMPAIDIAALAATAAQAREGAKAGGLLACAHCGSSMLAHEHLGRGQYTIEETISHTIRCLDCGSQITADTREKVVTAWNTRTPAVGAEVVVTEALVAKWRTDADAAEYAIDRLGEKFRARCEAIAGTRRQCADELARAAGLIDEVAAIGRQEGK